MHTEENYVPISGIFLKEVNPVSPNSPYCQTYDSYDIGLENLVKIPLLKYFLKFLSSHECLIFY